MKRIGLPLAGALAALALSAAPVPANDLVAWHGYLQSRYSNGRTARTTRATRTSGSW